MGIGFFGGGEEGRGHTLVVVDDIAQVVAAVVVGLAHAHGVVREVDVAVVAEDFFLNKKHLVSQQCNLLTQNCILTLRHLDGGSPWLRETDEWVVWEGKVGGIGLLLIFGAGIVAKQKRAGGETKTAEFWRARLSAKTRVVAVGYKAGCEAGVGQRHWLG